MSNKQQEDDMPRDYFTSDTHYFHTNIIKYCNRPYRGISEMNDALRAEWMKTVRPQDRVYHLGDVGFAPEDLLGPFLQSLPGNKFLILGNHDNPQILKKYFGWVKHYHELRVPRASASRGVQTIVLFHYAMRVWNKSHHGSWHLYGHSHGTLPDDPKALSMDVGVDPNRYKLLSVEDIAKKMAMKNWAPVDGHKAKEMDL